MIECKLEKGQCLHGFTILDIVEIEELKSLGISARHDKSGAELFHVFNDDEENLFSFAFSTAPEDSSGVAHILEHSVLCGSKHYPLKDTFIRLSQGSLNTFLNAMTFPDKTVYPASSANREDYFNLMRVYADAVFSPLLSKHTFLQEGWRYEFDDKTQLALNGVVYNEMKGAMSSIDRVANFEAQRALLPNTPYAHNSGGDPEAIPALSYEQLLAFHAASYNPANCKIFLFGNIPTEEQLALLDSRYLSQVPAGKAREPIQKTERWNKERALSVSCPGKLEHGCIVTLSWLLGDSGNQFENLELAALGEILLGHDGSPLVRALIDSRLGEDIAAGSGVDVDLRESTFTIGLRGVKKENSEKLKQLILDTLRSVCAQGISAEAVETALLSIEFSNKEIKRSGGPFSISLMIRSLRGWLHGQGATDTLLIQNALDALKEKIASQPRFFENLIQRLLLENPHCLHLTAEPDPSLNEQRENALHKTLTQHTKQLSADQKQTIERELADLEAWQSKAASEQDLATIKALGKKDLVPELKTVARQFETCGGTSAVYHDLFTNGISYLDIAIPVDNLNQEERILMPLLAHCIGAMGMGDMDYGQLAAYTARITGGIGCTLECSSAVHGSAKTVALPSGILDIRGRDWMILRCKALDEKFVDAAALCRDILYKSNLNDRERLRDLVLEQKNDARNAAVHAGHQYAMSRAARGYSASRQTKELWFGLDQLSFINAIDIEHLEDLAQRLSELRDRLLNAGALLNITCIASQWQAVSPALDKVFSTFTPPVSRVAPKAEFPESRIIQSTEVLFTDDLQSGFAACVIPAARFGSKEHCAELFLSHRLGSGFLWEDVRMKGGAYGAFAHPDGLDMLWSFASYRDGKPLRSLNSFKCSLEFTLEEEIDAEDFEKTLVGAWGNEVQPRAPRDHGYADFLRLLYGIEDSHRLGKLHYLLDLTVEDIKNAAHSLLSRYDSGSTAIVASRSLAQEAAEVLNIQAQEMY